MTDFRGLLRALAEPGVDFIIVGGAAATVHGSARLTLVLDIVYSRTPENMRRLVASLAPYSPRLRGAPAGLPFEWSERTLSQGMNFTLSTVLGDIDVFGEIAGGDYRELASDCVTVRPFGVECQCLKLDRLIQVKRAAGRPKDLEAIAELESLWDEGER